MIDDSVYCIAHILFSRDLVQPHCDDIPPTWHTVGHVQSCRIAVGGLKLSSGPSLYPTTFNFRRAIYHKAWVDIYDESIFSMTTGWRRVATTFGRGVITAVVVEQELPFIGASPVDPTSTKLP
jgi:hypothetical protein